jgi:hypothetical protein
MPAALRYFGVVILTQIGIERNERVIEKLTLDPDPRRTRLGCRDSYLIDATGVPSQSQLPGLAGFDPEQPVTYSHKRSMGIVKAALAQNPTDPQLLKDVNLIAC